MFVAFFTNNYKPFIGGVPIAVENLAKTLRRRGHRVLIFAPDYDGLEDDEPDVFRVMSIKNFNDTPFSLPLPLTLRPAYDLDALSEVDIVHVHHPFLLGMSGLQLARTYDVPVVFTYHTQYEKYIHYLPFPEKWTAEVAVRLATRFSNSCDAVIAPSSDIQRILTERGVQVPIHVIPTGVDLQKFRGGNGLFLRKKLNIDSSAPILLTVSRIAKEKNVGFLIEVFTKIAEVEPRAHIVLVGEGDARAELESQAHKLPCRERVHFLGALSGKDLVSAYKSADVFVFASTTETQGMVVLEAMACGLPVVAVAGPGIRDFVTNGLNGYLVEDGRSDDFAKQVLSILSDPECRRQFSDEAKRTARRWSLAETTKKVERLYRGLIKETGVRRKRERFIMLREIIGYHFRKLMEELDEFF